MKGLAMGTLYYTGQELLEVAKTSNGNKTRKVEKYRGRISYRDDSGRRRYKTKTLEATTKSKAKTELTMWRNQMEQERAISVKRGTEGNALAETPVPVFVESFVNAKESTKAIEPSTVKSYRVSLRYIRTGFANTLINQLQPQDVEDWMAELGEDGYSSSTIGKAYRLLKQALDNAVFRRAIDRNPLDNVKPPKRGNQKQGINSLDRESRNQLITAMESLALSPVVIAVYIALYTGMRRGEVCGLQWRDINEEKGFIWVRRAFGEGGGKGNSEYLKSPKTDMTRDVPMSKTLAQVLSRWKQIQQKRFAEDLSTLKPDSYVLGDIAGHYRMDRLTREWSNLAHLTGVVGTEGRVPTFHDLRHTFATFFLAAGGDVNTCASILGHADVSMTLNTYARADPQAKMASKDIIEDNAR